MTAVASPIPLLAPVTTTTLSLIPCMKFCYERTATEQAFASHPFENNGQERGPPGPVYLRVSAACLPNFFKSRRNVSRSFFERTSATSSIAAA
jgi:hypothetical protein